jgi:hypothetical protein
MYYICHFVGICLCLLVRLIGRSYSTNSDENMGEELARQISESEGMQIQEFSQFMSPG